MPADNYIPTTNLRFIERDIGHQRTGRILQQQWVIAGAAWGALIIEHGEWRDVPLGQDRPEPLTEEAADRRRRGLPDFEKPPLGQPPAFQEQEPNKTREETAMEERLARVDESLAKQLERSVQQNAKYLHALKWIAENGAGSHPANVVAVAEDALRP